eukprot:9203128-Karenia_brevis.AAC.1
MRAAACELAARRFVFPIVEVRIDAAITINFVSQNRQHVQFYPIGIWSDVFVAQRCDVFT